MNAPGIRQTLTELGQVQVQGTKGKRPLDDFTPYGNEERQDITLGHVYRGGQWIKVEIKEEG